MAKKKSKKAVKKAKPLFPGFFKEKLAKTDPKVAKAIAAELGRQQHEIELIASENIVSRAVLEAQGSVHDQQICRGLSGPALLRRLPVCRRRPRTWPSSAPSKLFDCGFANVQPHSGAQANQAVFFALPAARRHLYGPRSRLRRASDPRLARQPVGQVVQGRALRVREDNHLIDYD